MDGQRAVDGWRGTPRAGAARAPAGGSLLRPAGAGLPPVVHVGGAPGDGRPRSYDEVVRGPGSPELRRVRRGAYVLASDWSGWDAATRHRARIAAVLAVAQEPPVLSHWSAAVLHGLPVVGRVDDRVHTVRAAATGGRSRRDLVRHTTALPFAPVLVDGVPATSVARTILDVARVGGAAAAVVAGDHALRVGRVRLAELEAELGSLPPRARGAREARRAVGLLDARSESPGESLSRVRMDEGGLTAPVLQHVVRDVHGEAGRVDFWWPAARVVGEFDGRTKYRGDDGADPAEVVWREKVREDRIRATGVTVVRWTWREAWAGRPLVALLRRAGVR
ncbi:hypothetical protein [Cellulomonas shaoxiangyii]|uniref:Transcriptional regulator, AbiEi antitoxin, Type IV TA system n=1 Tax=Cellulomonas shaoxiangyii TaxID=2566013 RepID=A0A4P7SJ03_9CELL|nr:hypothetical protein [Cellulomonas shaoxiangyii]QCB94092.1 hypothetical protein E5225_11485 [Cellulomonas shaoxiangyii]TGY83746.1 hypothetical protein E5226_11795 [Cellulomonas shaoxiangyii]